MKKNEMIHNAYQLTEKQKRYLPVKRLWDIAICIPICLFLIPFMLIFAAAIKFDSPGPVFFLQKRVGKDKSYFKIWKFRTMRADAPNDIPTHLLEEPDAFITKVGRFMRHYSLDELPQIYQCLLTNSISLVGPRPALWNQEDLVEERDKYGVNQVKPGITGWAQINGRDELEISQKARLDGEYVKNLSFAFDCKCFIGTFLSVLKSEGIVEGGTGSMRKI